MYKLFILNVLLLTSAAKALVVGIESTYVRSDADLGEVVLLHSEEGFSVFHDGKVHTIQNYNVDEWLRPIKTEQLEDILKHSYLHLVRASDGEFILHGHVKGLGGGGTGATVGFYVGKGATYVVCWGTIGAVSAAAALINPYAGKSTFAALSKLFAAPIETLSNTVGAGTAIGGAVVTGPV